MAIVVELDTVSETRPNTVDDTGDSPPIPVAVGNAVDSPPQPTAEQVQDREEFLNRLVLDITEQVKNEMGERKNR